MYSLGAVYYMTQWNNYTMGKNAEQIQKPLKKKML